MKKTKKFGRKAVLLAVSGSLNLTYLEVFVGHLVRAKIIKPGKWHTVEFYCRAKKDGGFWIDEFRVSSCRRRKRIEDHIQK
jgi:hypothetical protein